MSTSQIEAYLSINPNIGGIGAGGRIGGSDTTQDTNSTTLSGVKNKVDSEIAKIRNVLPSYATDEQKTERLNKFIDSYLKNKTANALNAQNVNTDPKKSKDSLIK